MRTMLKSKIHRAICTGADVAYEGSITLDPVLMEAADILPHEQVHVVDCNNGARLVTYAIEGTRGEGEVILNGAAARLINTGDIVIIISYKQLAESELGDYRPRLVYVDGDNRIARTSDGVRESLPV
ncbi:MAG: aspartate 1-decarboxylase [Chloroflexi bacterium]|nr:aspartate 1-decarboxylase [Chloroflexota bacterium]MCH7952900.1 aspartate 1-decarboxylase [Chloroflexota bacterium]MCI0783532.1 aspartate 1-decarboxylase [Chloroflexota bacterium]MCI0814117.1 aspartate 1-decarboxylase [Chloroflexota bacterium]MCI0816895.1 aspartate 1-decarboxylase [Chloroflexota bacterium]